MIKLIASDLDGTLLHNGAQELPQELFPLIKELKEMGILFVAASGRQYANMRNLFAPIADEIGYVAENGALAVWKDQVLYENAFEKKLILDIIEDVQKDPDLEFLCSTKDYYYLMPKTEEYRRLLTDTVKAKCKFIKGIDEITESCIKMAVYDKKGVSDAMVEKWNAMYGERCTVVTSGYTWLDFVDPNANKDKGVREFQKLMGVELDECIVFGDECNDLQMLKSVKYSFAMETARDEVKKVAAYQTKRVETILRKLIAAGGKIEEIL